MSHSEEVQKKYYDNFFSNQSLRGNLEVLQKNNFFVERFIRCSINSDFKKILEIGCGDGFLTFFLLGRQLKITAIDISEKAIESMQKKFASEIEQGEITLKCADALDFFENTKENYDAIIGSGIIHHIEKKTGKDFFNWRLKG